MNAQLTPPCRSASVLRQPFHSQIKGAEIGDTLTGMERLAETYTYVAVQLGQDVWQSQVAFGSQQLLHQGGSRRLQHRMVHQHQLVANAASACDCPHQVCGGHDVDRILQKRTAA